MAITAPYTFVPFVSPIKAERLWEHDGCDDDPTRAFDRPLPGMLSGHIDLTLTACSALYVGDAQSSGTSFRWPGPGGRYAIPGASLRGMLRSQVEALTGAALGLGDGDQVWPTSRFPIRVRTPQSAADRNLNDANTDYRERRGDTSALGRQRVGLLTANPKTGSWAVQECSQFILPIKGRPSKMPSAQWRLVAADLLSAGAADRREDLKARRGTVVFVVWATVAVNRVPRPCVVGIGTDPALAQSAAAARIAVTGGIDTAVRLPGPYENNFTATFVEYLDADWQPCASPVAREMLLFPTNLANLDTHGLPVVADTPAANCYLLFKPTDALPAGHRPYPSPLPVGAPAQEELQKILETSAAPWTPDPPKSEQLQGWPTAPGAAAWPVFFDTDGQTVTHLGASGGFAILTEHTLKAAVRHARGRWTRALDPQSSRKNDVADVLFGAIDSNHQIRGRVEVGHATATTDLTPLIARPAALFSPHLQSAATRLIAPSGATSRVSFDDPKPAYRGRQFYWHRGDWTGTGEGTWCAHIRAHDELLITNAGQAPDPDRSVAPLPVGATFTSRITFTNLSRSELGLLLFVLNFAPANPADPALGPVFAHKIGGGKPLGLGSIHLAATASLLDARRYTHPSRTPATATGVSGHIDPADYINDFLEAVNWTTESVGTDWEWVPETGRRWPRHVAAWLLAHRWNPRPQASDTNETPVSDFLSMIPMNDLFFIANRAR